MKKLIVLSALFLFLCAQGCNSNLSAWVWSDETTGVRLGYVNDDTEVGVSGLWWEDCDEPEVVGVYAIRHLPDVVQVPNPIVLEWLPATLTGSPYFGAEIMRDMDRQTTYLSPIAGLRIEDIFFIGYRFGAFNEEPASDGIVFGIRVEF